MKLINFVSTNLSCILFKKTRLICDCTAVAALLLISVQAIAAGTVETQKFTQFMDAFPFLNKASKELSNEVVDFTTLEFALSSIKKVNGRWRIDSVKPLTGSSQESAFELNQLTAAEAAQDIKNTTAQLRWIPQFQCAGLACGTSYAWATQVFNNKLLDGIDALQYYWVWKTPVGWARMYLVERGNKRVYLQWQFVVERDTTAAAEITQWQEQGFADLELASIDTLTLEQLTPLLQWLKDVGGVGFALVGHSDRAGHSEVGGKIAQLQADSLQEAIKMANTLKTLQPELQVQTYGLGPLAPRRGKGARIEFVPIFP